MLNVLDLIRDYLAQKTPSAFQIAHLDDLIAHDTIARYLPCITQRLTCGFDFVEQRDIHDQSFLPAKLAGLAWLNKNCPVIIQQPSFDRTIEILVKFGVTLHKKISPEQMGLKEVIYARLIKKKLTKLYPRHSISEALQAMCKPLLSQCSEEYTSQVLAAVNTSVLSYINEPKSFSIQLEQIMTNDNTRAKGSIAFKLVFVTINLITLSEYILSRSRNRDTQKKIVKLFDHLRTFMPFTSDDTPFCINQILFHYAQFALEKGPEGFVLLVEVLKSSSAAYAHEGSTRPSCLDGIAERILLDCYALSEPRTDYIPIPEAIYAELVAHAFVTSDHRPSPIFLSLGLKAFYGSYKIVDHTYEQLSLKDGDDYHSNLPEFEHFLLTQPNFLQEMVSFNERHALKNVPPARSPEAIVKRFLQHGLALTILPEDYREKARKLGLLKTVTQKRLQRSDPSFWNILRRQHQRPKNLTEVIMAFSDISGWNPAHVEAQLSTLIFALNAKLGDESTSPYERIAQQIDSLWLAPLTEDTLPFPEKKIADYCATRKEHIMKTSLTLAEHWENQFWGLSHLTLLELQDNTRQTKTILNIVNEKIRTDKPAEALVWNSLSSNMLIMMIEQRHNYFAIKESSLPMTIFAAEFDNYSYLAVYLSYGVIHHGNCRILSAAFCMAIKHGHWDIVSLFLDHKLPLNDILIQEEPVLIWALKTRCFPLLDIMINHKIYVPTPSSTQKTPIEYAFAEHLDDLARVFMLIAPNSRHRYGQTCAHLAVIRNDRSLLEGLIKAGATLAATNDAGRTPLHLSVLMKRPFLTSLLLGHTPLRTHWYKDKTGRTAFDWAQHLEAESVLNDWHQPALFSYQNSASSPQASKKRSLKKSS